MLGVWVLVYVFLLNMLSVFVSWFGAEFQTFRGTPNPKP